jgi:hypothetical protein
MDVPRLPFPTGNSPYSTEYFHRQDFLSTGSRNPPGRSRHQVSPLDKNGTATEPTDDRQRGLPPRKDTRAGPLWFKSSESASST